MDMKVVYCFSVWHFYILSCPLNHFALYLFAFRVYLLYVCGNYFYGVHSF